MPRVTQWETSAVARGLTVLSNHCPCFARTKAGTNTPTNKQAMYAKYDLKKQVRQVGTAIKTGKKGTAAVRYGKK